MTNFDLIQQAIKAIENGFQDFAISNLKQFVRANTATPKAGKLNLYNWCAKDRLRPIMTGVFHDCEKKVAVATDTHVLVVSADDFREPNSDTDMIESCHHGYVICKNGEYQKGFYPRWENVIPQEPKITPISVDRERIRELLRDDAAAKKSGGRRMIAIRISSERSHAFIDPKYCKLLLTLPQGKFYEHVSKQMSKFVSDDGKVIALFMHIMQDDDRITEEAIFTSEN